MQSGSSNLQNIWRDRTIALAGIAHAVDIMDKLARTGYLNSRDFETSVRSLLEQNPSTTEAVFGDAHRIRRGYEVLRDLLKKKRGQDQTTALIGYCLGVLHLQQRLAKNRTMLNQVGERLGKCHHQVQHFGITHDNVIANIASIYSDTISTFPFRIQVVGEYQYLQQARVANQVRVLLLAAIRSATLWRQLGGTRWHLLLQRKLLISAAEELLDQAKRADQTNPNS